MDSNEREGICYAQPKTYEERVAIARSFVATTGYALPLYVDKLDDRAEELYAGWPERLYVIDEKGTIAYKGGPGPFEFEPDEVEAWLRARRAE